MPQEVHRAHYIILSGAFYDDLSLLLDFILVFFPAFFCISALVIMSVSRKFFGKNIHTDFMVNIFSSYLDSVHLGIGIKQCTKPYNLCKISM